VDDEELESNDYEIDLSDEEPQKNQEHYDKNVFQQNLMMSVHHLQHRPSFAMFAKKQKVGVDVDGIVQSKKHKNKIKPPVPASNNDSFNHLSPTPNPYIVRGDETQRTENIAFND
jgi:hypothetical protein